MQGFYTVYSSHTSRLPFASYAISLHNGSTATVDLQDVIPANGVAHYRLSLDARGNELGCPEIQ
jgi:hypothetical protein